MLLVVFISCKKNDPVRSTPPPPPPAKVPELLTYDVAVLSRYLTTVRAKVIDSGSSKIIEQGFLLDTIEMPDLNKNLYKLSTTLDSTSTFTLTLKDLPSNKKYFLRSYGRNSKGVGYGNQIQFNSFVENTFVGNVYLHSQQEVSEFGLNKYTRITGELFIDGPVNDLTPLLGLAVIESGFTVVNTQLLNFKGLDSLEYTGYIFANNFRVENNPSLVNFSGLSKLKITRGYFYVLKNNSLISLDGLESFESASMGDLDIRDCGKLKNIDGLKNLTFIGGDLNIINNQSLTNIKGLSNVGFIGYRLVISNNPSLINLDGLEKIDLLRWGIELSNNTSLRDINGIRNLTKVQEIGYTQGKIFIKGNDVLSDINALNNIVSADYVSIKNNPLLQSLKGLENIQSITETLEIENNPKLLNLVGLDRLKKLSSLVISNNDALIDLNGLNQLTEISNNVYSLRIELNKNLESLTGLESLIAVSGSLNIGGNPLLKNFCPIKPLFAAGYSGPYLIADNLTNPSRNEIITECN